MFICSVWVFVNGVLRRSKPSRSKEAFLDRHGILVLVTVGFPVFLLVFLTDYISMYFAMALFLFYYLMVLGRHGLLLSGTMAVILPAWMYLFFDITMTRTLPKGTLALEDGLYSPLGPFLRNTAGWNIGLLFLVGAVLLAGASWLSARSQKTP